MPPSLPRALGSLLSSAPWLDSYLSLAQSCSPASAIWGHLPTELFALESLSQVCSWGYTQEDRDPTWGLGLSTCQPGRMAWTKLMVITAHGQAWPVEAPLQIQG